MALHRTERVPCGPGRFRDVTVTSASELCGSTKDAVTGLKYRNERRNARVLAGLLVPLVPAGVDAVTWAPTAETRRMRRGVDHAELIARHVAASSGLPAARLLRRLGSTQQTGNGAGARGVGPGFVASGACAGLSVLVVDDVVTTGSTMRSACAALFRAGAGSVHGLTVASVP